MSQSQFAAATGVGATWLSDTVRECQAFLGDSLAVSPGQLSAAAASFLERLPTPRNPLETLTQRGLLLELAIQYGYAAHVAFHEHSRSRARRCVFRAALCVEEWPTDVTGSPVEAFRRWAVRFEADFQIVHPLTCAQSAKEHIEEHFRGRILVNSIASRIGCSRRYLQRTFKTLTGLTMPQYQGELRLAEALRLLAHEDIKIEAVAAAVGYRSKKDLYRVVRTRLGCTPLQYRRRRERHKASPQSTRGKDLTVRVSID